MTPPLILHSEDIANTPSECFPSSVTGGKVTWKTLMSEPKTSTNTFTSGIATCEPGDGHLKLHRHKQAELYHVTEGRGIVYIDGKEHEVAKGSVVFIPGDAEHGIRNTGEENLVWLYVFATDGFGDVVYRFSEEQPKAKL
ncbi:RmlC-like cupin [Corynespora cassiicola Philippines]|uniref:RmlC-like cupin n=1 Tax=Corynespora cassiicola Philippines TaxID=1448308 RepID=A0A2T2P9G8_CORCC|nr:RmlC-like cupin [Corynespora cassiicola Philippines]